MSSQQAESHLMLDPRAPISFDINGLYILLSDIGEVRQFHWGLYLALGPSYGVLFHVVNNVTTGYTWQYQTKTSTTVPYSITLLTALKIAVMDPALHTALADRLAAVPLTPPVTCRLWLRRALRDLDDEGYVSFQHGAGLVAEEAEGIAIENKMSRTRSVTNSGLSQA